MPFTPFHFGPSAIIALPLNRYIDIPAFLLANIAVDLEPLTVILFSLSYPLHGYAHSFLGSSIICIILGFGLFHLRNSVIELMQKAFKKSYTVTRNKVVLSALAGGLFHVLLDSMLYHDIKPFFPNSFNPFLGVIGQDHMYLWCALAFIPAFIIYYALWRREKGR